MIKLPLQNLSELTKKLKTVWEKRDRLFFVQTLNTTSFVLLAVFLVFVYGYFFLYLPPSNFPVSSVVHIPDGMTLSDASVLLADKEVVHSASALDSIVVFKGGEQSVQAGDYFFDRPLTLLEVAQRILVGNYGLLPVKVTVPEGATTYEIATLYANKLGGFDAQTFLVLAKNKEGYLFPDTYYFLPNATAAQVIDTMEQNFYRKIGSLEEAIADFGKPLDEVLTMASLLEKEARTPVSRRTIAGILWNRIDVGMPLQVDAVFGYIMATSTFSPKFSHLAIDSPYNTYKYKGLPPGPIANPSLASIKAAITPVASSYLYYLSDRRGQMHYSVDYSQHLRYKRMYLN